MSDLEIMPRVQSAVIPPAASKLASIAEDLNDRCMRSAEDAIRNALACGATLLQLRAMLPGTFTSLLRSKRLVNFGYTTAYKYMSMAEEMLPAKFRAQIEDPYIQLDLEPPNYQLPEIPELSAEAGKSLNQIFRERGIISKSKAGGARDGAGRKRNDESDISAASMIDGAVLRIATAVRDLGGHPIGEQDAGRIRAAATQLRELLAEISGLLRTEI